MRRSRRYVRHSVFMPMDRGHLAKRENTPKYRSRGDRLAGTKTKSALNLEVLSRSFAPVRHFLVFDDLPLIETARRRPVSTGKARRWGNGRSPATVSNRLDAYQKSRPKPRFSFIAGARRRPAVQVLGAGLGSLSAVVQGINWREAASSGAGAGRGLARSALWCKALIGPPGRSFGDGGRAAALEDWCAPFALGVARLSSPSRLRNIPGIEAGFT